MSRPLLRHLRTAGTAALVVAGLALTAGWFHVRTSLRSLDGVHATAVADTVAVRSDSFAVPHVHARGEADLFYAQGWIHASQRLWQMELFRRIARGRLSELFGPQALETDRLLRTLDLWGAAGRSVAALDGPERRALEAYAAGVNARLESWEGALPPEFLVLGVEPEPWTPRASVAVGKMMALDLSTWRRELSRFRTRRAVSPEKYRAVEPSWPEWAPTILPAYRRADPTAPSLADADADGGTAAGSGEGPPPRAGAAGEPEPTPTPAARPAATGPGTPTGGGWDPFRFLSGFAPSASNNWALAGSRTRSGHPLLANDMHLGLRAPALWYVMGLHAGPSGLEAAGLTLPGAPGVVVGFNRGVAWSFTNGMVDDMDFAVETLSADGTAYRTADGWRELAVRPETIRVRGRDEPEVLRVRETVRGPLITDVLPGLETPLSALWAAARPTTEVAGLLAMNRARDPAAFGRAVRAFDSPQQNVVFAAADGTLGYRLSGRVPRRAGWDGRLPAPAREVGGGWPGVWPPGSHPAVRARPGDGGVPAGDPLLTGPGFLASANNLQAPGLFGVLGVDYPLPFRARRIVDRLSGARGWTSADAADLQRDTRSLLADRLVPRAVDAARRAGADSVAETLAGWDREVDRDSRAAGVFYAWVYRLRTLVAADELQSAGEWAWFPISALLRVVGDPESAWIDDVGTPDRETLPALEERALRDAAEATGLRPWGEMHRETHVHPLGRVAWLDRLFGFDVGPHPSPGAPRTVRPDDYRRWRPLDGESWRPPWTNEYGPSQRLVVTLGPGAPAGRVLLPTGQSGNPLDRHYRDMSRRWRDGGELVELPLDREAVERRTVRVMRLVPDSAGAAARPGDETPAR